MEKKSFVLYLDSLDILDDLTGDQTKELLTAIRDYNLGKEVQLSGLMKAVFNPFKNSFDRDLEKYNAKCAKNRESARKRWDKKDANASERIKKDAKHADSDNDSDSDNDNDNVKESEKIILSDSKIETKKDIPEFIQNELKPFFNLKNISSAFQFLNSLNGEYESFKQQFFDYKLFQETSKQYKKSFGSFCNKWNETDFKASLNDLKEIKNDSEKNHFPDIQSQKVKNVNGKTVYRVIPDANGKPIINPNF